MNIVKQKPKTDWQDEAGNYVEYSQLKPVEKVNENSTYKIAVAAYKASSMLSKLKHLIVDEVAIMIAAFHNQYSGKKTAFKGNYTIFNFNQSVKVEISVSQPIKFDDLLIQQAKAKLDEFLNEGITTKKAAVKTMLMDAFETSRGKLDVKKILGLKRHADRINDEKYNEAMQMIDLAIRRPSTATYYRVAVRNDKGQYEYIKLALADL